jgi:hypothetical protein
MKTLVIAIAALALLAPVAGWAQSSPAQAPAAPPASTSPAPPAPGRPPATVPDSTTPRAQTPGTPDATAPRTPGAPAVPGDRVADGRIFGLSPLAAIIFGLVILGVIIALMAGRRRDRDVVVDTRVDATLPPERPIATTESEIERERRRRAS